LKHILGWERTALYTKSSDHLPEKTLLAYEALQTSRLAGKPIAYLLGEQEFWSLPLRVTEDVLVPRADTELLVATALALLPSGGTDILDLGTGSGAIALAIASERADCHITAVDISAAALRIARLNAHQLGLKNLTFLESHWFTSLPVKRYALIASNPPYVPITDPHLDSVGVRHEPRLALVSGTDGLDDIRSISSTAAKYLRDGGKLLFEHGFDQGPEVCELLDRQGYSNVVTLKDAAGNERVTHGTLNNNEQH